MLTSARAMRVLVVDDDVDTVQSTALMLEFDGHEVETATDGVDAIERAATLQPDLVLLDIAMPNMAGYDVLRRIQSLALPTPPYSVAVTGYGRPEDKRRCAEAGFDLHLLKPVGQDTFRELTALLQTSERLTEHVRELAIKNRAAATELMLRQIEMANIFLNCAATTSIDGARGRCIVLATRAHARISLWLQTGACTDDRVFEAVEALGALQERLRLA